MIYAEAESAGVKIGFRSIEPVDRRQRGHPPALQPEKGGEMSLNTALAISLGVLGAVATWLFLGPLGGVVAVWAAFIAWGCYYHSGGKEAGLQSTILGTAAGAVIAGITLAVASASVGASLPANMWVALCVGLGVAAMVLLANVPLFANIPAQVYGFASTVAMALLPATPGSVTEASMANPVVTIILSMIVGAIFGYVSEKVAGMLMGAGDHRAAAKA